MSYTDFGTAWSPAAAKSFERPCLSEFFQLVPGPFEEPNHNSASIGKVRGVCPVIIGHGSRQVAEEKHRARLVLRFAADADFVLCSSGKIQTFAKSIIYYNL